MMHIIEENSLEICTPLKEALLGDMNGMSTTKADDILQKRSRAENAHDDGCEASFSSQEECSGPAFQLNTVQAVFRKLQRPVCSCGSRPDKPSEQGNRTVGTIILKLQRPTRPCCQGLGHQDALWNEALQKDIKQKNVDQLSGFQTEIKPTAECELRPLTLLSISGSRGESLLSNADKGCMKRSASRSISQSSKENEDKQRLSDISEQRNEEVRLSLGDIDAIASSSHLVSTIPPYQKKIGSEHQSVRSELPTKKVPKSSVSTGEPVQYPTAASRRNQISTAPEEEQRSTRITEPPANDAGQNCVPASERNPNLIVPDQGQPHLTESDPPAPTTGVIEVPSDASVSSERQNGIEATQEKQALK